MSGKHAVLYGNADTNAAWSTALPGNCPVRVEQGRVRLPEGTLEGDDLTGWFMVSRGRSNLQVGVVADTGLKGIRAGYLVPARSPSDSSGFYSAALAAPGTLRVLTPGSPSGDAGK
jgi:hypothetical protein